MRTIDRHLQDLREQFGYTAEELKVIKSIIADYAMAACMDSDIRKEVMDVLTEEEKENGGT